MLYVCRSSLLRLGQPWRTFTRAATPPRQLLSRTALLVFYSTSAFNGPPKDDTGSSTLDDLWNSTSADRQWHPMLDESMPTEREELGTIGSSEHRPRPDEDGRILDYLDLADHNLGTVNSVDRTRDFISQMGGADDPEFTQRALDRISVYEEHRMRRLRKWDPLKAHPKLIYAIHDWKAFVKTGPGLFESKAEANAPLSLYSEKVIKWIQSSQSWEELATSVPRPRLLFEKLLQDAGLMKTALRNAPAKTPIVLEYILRDHAPESTYSAYMFEDALNLLALRLHGNQVIDKCALALQLADLVSLIVLETSEMKHVQPFQATIYKILCFLPPERAQSWYKELLSASCHLSIITKTEFASRLAKCPGTKTTALQILQSLVQEKGIDINSPIVVSTTTSLLTFTEQDLRDSKDGIPTPADIFAALHELGLAPNLYTYANVIRALCIRGDIDTALECFKVLKHQGLQPNAFIYGILVYGCRRAKAYELLADLAVEAHNAGVANTAFWNDVLWAIYEVSVKEARLTPRSVVFPMNVIFTRVFDPSPLRPFITGAVTEVGQHFVNWGKDVWFPNRLRRLDHEIGPLPPRELLPPQTVTLGIFLLCLIRSLPQPHEIVVFYVQFKKLLQERHPEAERLVKDLRTFMYDAILNSLVSFRSTMRLVLDIMRDMLVHADQDGGTGFETDGREWTTAVEAGTDTVQPPAPSVYTWSILVKMFMRHKQPHKAEQCIDLMRQHGIEPNLVTWNTMVAGYASMQNVRKTVHTMRRLEAAGFEADDWTMQAFGLLKNKSKAIQIMEEVVELNRLEQEGKEVVEQGLYPDDEQFDNSEEGLVSESQDATTNSAAAASTGAEDPFSSLQNAADPQHNPRQQHHHHTVQKEEQGQTGPSPLPWNSVDAQLDALLPETTRFGRTRRQWPKTVEKLKKTAPVDERYAEHFETWYRIRSEGIARTPPPKSLADVQRTEWQRRAEHFKSDGE